MLINTPTSEGLNEAALRSYFDTWIRALEICDDFAEHFGIEIDALGGPHDCSEEWLDYSATSQPELSHLVTMLLQSAELRLKALLCAQNPAFLLLNGSVKFNGERSDIDFTELRTLDAVDLPKAVRMLTEFDVSDAFLGKFHNLRRMRNRTQHLGLHSKELSPLGLISDICEIYRHLWPEGRWLYNRVRFDGRSTRRYFYDFRWASAETSVMYEFPIASSLMDNAVFKLIVGTKKSSLTLFCPYCLDSTASKDSDGKCETVARISETQAKCFMCEKEIKLEQKARESGYCECGLSIISSLSVEGHEYACCAGCGDT